ncbi:MAG: outer membrane beta-barrel protein [Cyclobacteriaceae bacterium]|nr:outer membrane beta-barrel protein [Cyclobacteriaceae bacterium]
MKLITFVIAVSVCPLLQAQVILSDTLVHETQKDMRHEKNADHQEKGKLQVVPGGYIETFYSYNFNRPENNITALRGFDFIHNSLTIGNFVMSTDARYDNFIARVALNVGANPSQFYEQEAATVPSYQVPQMDRFSWQFIQEALIGWHVKRVPGLTIQAGVMATPIGIEGLPNHQTWRESMESEFMLPKDYRENWHWSRSNSFINVPDYHSGIRFLYSRNSSNHFGVFLKNGQNKITDNNKGKTWAFTYLWTPNPGFHISALYMAGPERDLGAPEGQGWRHLFDYNMRWEVTKNFTFMTQFAPGFENTNFGTNWWAINVFYASWKFDNDVRLAFRYEHLLEKAASGSSSVYLRSLDQNNTGGLYGYTSTLSIPIVPKHLLLRLEYRHDRSPLNWFYRGDLEESGNEHEPYLPNTHFQNTVTIGMVGWF